MWRRIRQVLGQRLLILLVLGIGFVGLSWRGPSTLTTPSFDLLVRSPDAASMPGRLAPADLQALPGGISWAAWEQIKAIPGVEVAAPLTDALTLELPVMVPRLGAPLGLYRMRWEMGDATGDQWFWFLASADQAAGIPPEAWKAAGITPVVLGQTETIPVPVTYPFRLVGIDPEAERGLLQIDQAVTAGGLLGADAAALEREPIDGRPVISLPVLSSVGERLPWEGGPFLYVDLDQADWPAEPTVERLTSLQAAKPSTVRSIRYEPPNTEREKILSSLLTPATVEPAWGAQARLAPSAPVYESRTNLMEVHASGSGATPWSVRAPGAPISPLIHLRQVGSYDPMRIAVAKQDPSRLLYHPTEYPSPPYRCPAGALCKPMPPSIRPSNRPEAYLQAAPELLTSLEALRPILPSTPIGTIRVRVQAGSSRAQVEEIGRRIVEATGLQVEVVRGASWVEELLWSPDGTSRVEFLNTEPIPDIEG